jgi:acetoin utilization deacetylase AcuC-like enzyme
MRVGIVRDSIYLQHITDDFHPESPRRLESIYAMLANLNQVDLVYVPARPATPEEICLVHDQAYFQVVSDTKGETRRRLDPDTVTSPLSYDAACTAAGGVLELIDALLAGRIDNGFALVRPPGHHAESGRAMGFCIFNNIAIAARYAQKQQGIKRILIVDFDLHHGNGTQHSFYDDPSVLYISTHQYPFYPGTGWYDEVGEKDGKGYTINIPLSGGMGDTDYTYVFREIILPVSRLFRPEMVLVSAGFDIHRSDPLGGMAVTERGFAAMTRLLLDIAESECGGKVLFVLEGGYDTEGLTNSVKTTILELRNPPVHVNFAKNDNSGVAVTQVVARVKEVLKPCWGRV